MLGFMTNSSTATKLIDDDAGRLSETTKEGEIVSQAQEAAKRIRSNNNYVTCQRWSDWCTIAQALQIGQSEAMRAAGTNKPQGPRYRKAFSEWLASAGLEDIADKDVRCRLLYLNKNINAVDDWFQTLPSNQREKMNHPNTVWRAFKKPRVISDPTKATQKLSPFAKMKQSLAEREEELANLKAAGEKFFAAKHEPEDVVRILTQVFPEPKLAEIGRLLLAATKQSKPALQKRKAVKR